MPPDESKGILNGDELDGVDTDTDKNNDRDPSSAVESGAVLTLPREKTKERLCSSEFGNRVEFDQNTDDKDKENEPLACDPHHSSQLSVEILESQGHEQGEVAKEESDVFLKIPASFGKVQKQGVLTSSNTQLISAPSGKTSLNDLFGYKPSFKSRDIVDHSSVDTRENEDGVPVNTIVVVNIESGYLSDTEMSTDSDTPIPTRSAVSRLTALPSTGKLHFGQGSAVGTKVCYFCCLIYPTMQDIWGCLCGVRDSL